MTIESKILEELRSGSDPIDIVIKYGVEPDRVMRLYDKFLEDRLRNILSVCRTQDRIVDISDLSTEDILREFPRKTVTRVEEPVFKEKIVEKRIEIEPYHVERPAKTIDQLEIEIDRDLEKKFKKISKSRPVTEKKVSVFDFEVPEDIIAIFLVSCVVTFFDILTTRVALLHPNLYEMNPIMQFLMNFMGVEQALLVNAILSLSALFGLTLLSAKSRDIVWRVVPLTVYTTIRIIPVVQNYKLIMKFFHMKAIALLMLTFMMFGKFM